MPKSTIAGHPLHPMLIVALAATATNVTARKNKPDHRGGSLLLSALATVGVLVSGWFGGRLVYEQGMRVKGVSPIEYAPEMKLPGDELIEKAMLKEERLVPASGLYLH